MERKEILDKLNIIFRDVFDNDKLSIFEETTSNDVEGWDSLMHIMLISTIENEFDVKFMMKDVISMKNVGDMINILEKE